MLKRRIHENLNKAGISNLPKPKRKKGRIKAQGPE